jgi:hypothetical protein
VEAKEKAKELFDKYYYLFPDKHRIDFGLQEAKKCAIIAVDEILNCDSDIGNWECHEKYYKEVKQEIEKL